MFNVSLIPRFVFLDHSSNKLNNRLTFPIDDLDISEYVAEGFKKDVGNYDLYSCVCHSGSKSNQFPITVLYIILDFRKGID